MKQEAGIILTFNAIKHFSGLFVNTYSLLCRQLNLAHQLEIAFIVSDVYCKPRVYLSTNHRPQLTSTLSGPGVVFFAIVCDDIRLTSVPVLIPFLLSFFYLVYSGE